MRSHDLAATNAWLLVELPTLLVAVMVGILTPLALTAAGVPRAWGADYTTIARHTLWLFGIHYLTLNYAMRPRAP